jgi:hypothetical protein
MTFNLRIALFTLLVLVAALASPANAQSPGPGWTPTGEWQCGPHVRIISSTDGFGAVNFEIKGAWFDNNYTLRRGTLYYNGVPCGQLGDPMAFVMQGKRGSTTGKRLTDDDSDGTR